MNISLYYNKSESNQVGKKLQDKLTLSGTFRDEAEVVNPVVTIQHKNPVNFNYAYIPQFSRYYFINGMTAVRNNFWRLELNVDVLESFKEYFMNLNCIIDKYEGDNFTNVYFNDGTFNADVRHYNEIISFNRQADGLGEPFYLLTVI